ncbi:reverse transcriptase domain-containing protein [Tanacetum coccineum]|uniref:Reverse transcriptase domain-containing protein n=1 Tax=Tanacetum coccineum TaxID=301880 RepID=A0ABQ5FIP6_9ASTR
MAHKSMSQTKRQEDKVVENASNKRMWEGNHNGSSSQQNKGHKVPRAHTTRPINKKAYAGSLPLCNQCKFHHNEPYTVKCINCKKVGDKTENCRTPAAARNQRTRTCYECGSLRHYKSVAIAYTAGSGERKKYAGPLSLCNKCKSPATTNNQRNLTCYECGNQGHYRSDCPRLKNQNHGNQTEGIGTRGVVHALGGGETDQDLNNIEDEIEA